MSYLFFKKKDRASRLARSRQISRVDLARLLLRSPLVYKSVPKLQITVLSIWLRQAGNDDAWKEIQKFRKRKITRDDDVAWSIGVRRAFQTRVQVTSTRKKTSPTREIAWTHAREASRRTYRGVSPRKVKASDKQRLQTRRGRRRWRTYVRGRSRSRCVFSAHTLGSFAALPSKWMWMQRPVLVLVLVLVRKKRKPIKGENARYYGEPSQDRSSQAQERARDPLFLFHYK